jgi:hypothetical protein
MLRLTTLVLVLCALLLTACVQPTPTPETTPAATSASGQSTLPANTPDPASYPDADNPYGFPTPTPDLSGYPEGTTP